LTPKEQRFTEEYPIDWNGAAAARRSGYSANSARTVAYNLLTKEYIRDAIRVRMEELTMTANEVLSRLGCMARGEIPTVINVDKDGEQRETYDAKGALENLAKAHALFIDKVQIETYGLEFVEDADEEDKDSITSTP